MRYLHRSTQKTPKASRWISVSAGLLVSLVAILPTRAVDVPLDVELRLQVQADWAAQEQRADRQPGDLAAIRAAVERTERLLENLIEMPGAPDVKTQHQALRALQCEIDEKRDASPETRLELYHRVRWLTRELAWQNPLLADRPIAFLQRRRFICQMLHEYIGYYYNYADLAGGGVCVLERPGRSLRIRQLTEHQLPRGAYATLATTSDGATLYFAFAEVRDAERPHAIGNDWTILPSADQVPDSLNYYAASRSSFHLFAIHANGENLRQLTFGCEDDFDPCPLPDGRLLFMSSRRGGFCRCDNPFEPIPTHTLHRWDPATGKVDTLSQHETNEWHPALLNDGRVVYCRWDYVDRSAAHFHGLWVSNPDGSNPRILFGNYTKNLSACYQPRAIPGSNRIAFLAGAHHANVGGSLVLFDPSRVQLDPGDGEDRFESLERLTPEVCFPETAEGWPSSFFHSPCPLSEDYYLTAFSFEPLPGMGSGTRHDSETGIYYFDRFGNLELLYRQAGICSLAPIPLAPRPPSPQLPEVEVTQDEDAAEGEFILADVSWSLLPMPADRPVRELRIFQVLPKEVTHIANLPRIGMANAEPARILLGTVPVELDGSAYFRAPAGKPLYFQAVDSAGRAVQSMRSITYLQPGEQRGCVGCHEAPNSAPPQHALLALRRPASVIQPGPDGSHPLCFPRLVQPVLDRHCLGCHQGQNRANSKSPQLTGEVTGQFTRSYDNLRPYVRWYEWGNQSIAQTVTRPGQCGADQSPLTAILEDDNHRALRSMPVADWQRIYLWLDANAPFFGVYRSVDQNRQLAGDAVPPPELQ